MLPILATRYLPFTDAPEHAAAMATLRHWGDPVFAGPYELVLFKSQYVVYHLAGAAVTALVGDAELANRLLLSVAGALLPLSFRVLLRAASRDERLALFACLPFWSRPLVLGFLPFVASIPLAFYSLALVFRLSRSPKAHVAKLAFASVLLFYAHVSTWMLFVVSAAAVCAVAGRLRPLLALAPSAFAAGVWLLVGRLTLGAGSIGDGTEISRMSMGRSILAMPLWIFDVWRSHGDELAAGAWWLGFFLVAMVSVGAAARYSRRALLLLYAPFASVLFLYLATPWRMGSALMLNVRLAPILVLLALLPTRLPRRGYLTSLALSLALFANLAGGISAFVACRAAARTELGDLDRVLASMPGGTRLLTLTFDLGSASTHIYPWAHVGAYHRVRSGGVAGFSFTELSHWPLHYKAAERPPIKEGATWDIHPCSFRNAVDGAYYDFVLVRGRVDPFAGEPEGPVFRPLVTTGTMTLFRKEAGTWPPKASLDGGPCADERPQ